MTKYEVVVIWDDGEKETTIKDTREEAEEIAAGYKIAFGNQVQFTCVNAKEV